MEWKNENTTVKNAVTECPNCGAENAAGTHNCIYCGSTLVDITRTETNGRILSPNEVPDATVEAMRQRLTDFTGSMKEFSEALREVNERRNPDFDKEKGKKRVKLIGVVVIVLTILGFWILRSLTLTGMGYATGGGSVSGFGILPVIVFVIILSTVAKSFAKSLFRPTFTQTRKTTTIFEKQCASCGASNPAASSYCAYCGSSLANATTETRYGDDHTKEVTNAAADLVLKAINKEYDIRDKIREQDQNRKQ